MHVRQLRPNQIQRRDAYRGQLLVGEEKAEIGGDYVLPLCGRRTLLLGEFGVVDERRVGGKDLTVQQTQDEARGVAHIARAVLQARQHHANDVLTLALDVLRVPAVHRLADALHQHQTGVAVGRRVVVGEHGGQEAGRVRRRADDGQHGLLRRGRQDPFARLG